MQRWLYQLQHATVLNATLIPASSSKVSTSSPVPQIQETTPEAQATITKTKKSGGFFSRSKR